MLRNWDVSSVIIVEMEKKFYVTTAIPYVNGKPHIGHALEYFQADAIRRYRQLLGDKVLLLSGADENALKNVQAAEKEGLSTEEYLDKYSQIWQDAYEKFGVHLDVFQRGSDRERHWPGVQKLWQLCERSGDIYKKSYEGLYCIGCESFKTEAELVGGLCPDHQKKPEFIKEDNYFFKLSRYQEKLTQLIESNELKITPDNKRAETIAFMKQGLQDFSISRSNERAKGVGVPIPGDDSQKMYVWFDALSIYITGVGFGTDEERYKKWWPADVHIIGKDINRFHTVYWPAMLLSAGLALPKEILIHSFINAEGGEKLSKSLGNSPDPFEIVDEYGLEPFRYYLLSQIPLSQDGNFSFERLREVYTADLANGLGNLVARVAKLCEQINLYLDPTEITFDEEVSRSLQSFKFNEALGSMWAKIHELDKYLNDKKPWMIDENLAEESERKADILSTAVEKIRNIAFNLQPFMPETAEKITEQFKGPKIASAPGLFPRLQ